MKACYAVVVLAVLGVSVDCRADDLTATKAQELLQPVMGDDCGFYYTEQGEPDFAELENKPACIYRPRVTQVVMGNNSATVEYNHDRDFNTPVADAWLKDYAKMEAHIAPTMMFKALKKNLEKWKAESAGVDHTPRPGQATFKLDATGWKVDSAPQGQ